MQAAEKIFEGKFDDVQDEEGDVEMASKSDEPKRPARMTVSRECTVKFALMVILLVSDSR